MDYSRQMTAALKDRCAERKKTKMTRPIVLSLLSIVLCLLSSCSISYKMNGANINYQTTHSISIADLYTRQTRLQVLRKNGDLEIEGEIVGYDLTQGAIKPDSYASESKLTIRITVHFTNNINPEESFDRTYSAYQTFDASRLLTDVQDELCAAMIEEITNNIYNDTVAKW